MNITRGKTFQPFLLSLVASSPTFFHRAAVTSRRPHFAATGLALRETHTTPNTHTEAMVSFCCDNCGEDGIRKQKVADHIRSCRTASVSCIDCYVSFPGTSYQGHTTCKTEAEKVQGKLYRGQKVPGDWSGTVVLTGGRQRKSGNDVMCGVHACGKVCLCVSVVFAAEVRTLAPC